MREGDRVYFNQPFQPDPTVATTYRCGIVAAIVKDETTAMITDVLVQLYDLDQDAVYVDEFGAEVLHRFLGDELNLQAD
ncbi:MAG: hypothetical protein AB4042_13815 [Leptolyngbyaceae cyanobacterium]